MPAPAQEFEALARLGFVLGLGQYAATQRDHGVARQHMRRAAGDGYGLFAGHAFCVIAGKFALARGFVDFRRLDPRGLDAEPREKFASARACGCEHKFGRGHARCQNWPGPPRPGMKR